MGKCIPHDLEPKSLLKLGACVFFFSKCSYSVLVFFLIIAQSDLGEITLLDEKSVYSGKSFLKSVKK